MPETIKAAELPMVGIFNNNYRFEIPDYQRPYSWTTDQAGELLDDLLYAVRRSGRLADVSPYFLGSVVIIKDDTSPKAEIVDGQQRITTLTMLLCVLRELAGESSGAIDSYIRTPDEPFAGIEGHFRLTIRERDSEFFQENIQKAGRLPDFLKNPPANLPDSRQRMFENARYLWNELSKLDQTSRDALTGYIIQKCYLVIVSTSDQASAYRIFSVLNDRGLDLSPTDLLKAQIIGSIEEQDATEYTKIWEDEEEDLGRDGFRDLFAHIRMINLKNKMRRTLQDEFWEGVLQIKNGEKLDSAKAKRFIDEMLKPYSDLYEEIITSSFERQSAAKNEGINRYLGYLNQLDNFDWIPPVLEFFKRNPTDAGDTFQFVRDMERLAYGLFILRADINRRIRRYSDILRAIESGEELFEYGPLQLSDDEKPDILRILYGPIYSLPRVPRPLMLRLDSLSAGTGASYNHKIISIEHVLPQHPPEGSQWFEWFPDEEQRMQWTHKLANLVLLSRKKNSQANNREFNEKKHTYFMKDGVSPFALTTQVVAEDKWTPCVLERRQKSLIDALKKEWRLG